LEKVNPFATGHQSVSFNFSFVSSIGYACAAGVTILTSRYGPIRQSHPKEPTNTTPSAAFPIETPLPNRITTQACHPSYYNETSAIKNPFNYNGGVDRPCALR